MHRGDDGHWVWDDDGTQVFVSRKPFSSMSPSKTKVNSDFIYPVRNKTGRSTARSSSNYPHSPHYYTAAEAVSGEVISRRMFTGQYWNQWVAITSPEEIVVRIIKV